MGGQGVLCLCWAFPIIKGTTRNLIHDAATRQGVFFVSAGCSRPPIVLTHTFRYIRNSSRNIGVYSRRVSIRSALPLRDIRAHQRPVPCVRSIKCNARYRYLIHYINPFILLYCVQSYLFVPC